jgi:hypothetical protein
MKEYKFNFYLDNRILEVQLFSTKRKTIQIKIENQKKIKVNAPYTLKIEEIIYILNKKSNWIKNKIIFFEKIGYVELNKKFEEGERFLFLGDEYILKFLNGKGVINKSIYLEKNFLIYTYRKNDPDSIKNNLKIWYKKESLNIINKRINHYKKYFDYNPRDIKVKEQNKRWGSCTYKDDLLFNWKIIMMKIDVIDYIVIHEMCHMKYKNHSKDFWILVSNIMPDYKEKEKWLKENSYKIVF